MNRINAIIKLLSPVHIGEKSEEFSEGVDFICFNSPKTVALLDIEKVLAIVGEDNIDKWVAVLDNAPKEMRAYLEKRKPELTPNDIARRVISVKNVGRTFKGCIYSMNTAIIPGSSIKGSIRTLLLAELISRDAEFVQRKANLGIDKKGKFVFNDEKIMAYYLANAKFNDPRYKVQHDIFRFLRVGDFHFKESESTIIFKNNIINLAGRNEEWVIKSQNASYLECLKEGKVASGNFQIPTAQKNIMQSKNFLDKNMDILDFTKIPEIVNQHTLRLVEYEIEFWENEGAPTVIGNYLDYLYKIKESIISANTREFVLRVGAGSGWDFMTAGWPKEDEWAKKGDELLDADTWENLKQTARRSSKYPKGLMFPKTRKLLEGGIPAGFIKITLDS